MAFPGTFNFTYYKGDTYEFRVYPKDASGAVFDLESFETTAFTISDRRGPDGLENQIEAFTKVSEDFSFILCTIRPADGNSLIAGTPYVYDVEISKPTGVNEYPIVYTLLTGDITVRDQVTGAV
jgi:hypothetical protein